MATAKKTTRKTTKKAAPAKRTTARKSESKKHLGVFIGIIAAAVVAVVVAAVCFICFSKPKVVGTYKLTGIERDGEDQSSSISILEGLGMKATLELKEDKTGELDLFGDKSEVKYDNKQITINGASTDYTYKDGKFSMEDNGAKLIFTKNEE